MPMPSVSDLYQVASHRDALLAKSRISQFASWWQAFIDDRETVSEQSLGEYLASAAADLDSEDPNQRYRALTLVAGEMYAQSFAYAMLQEERFGQRALALARLLCESNEWLSPRHFETYPELHADLGFSTLCSQLAAAAGWLSPILDANDIKTILATLAARGQVIYDDVQLGAWWGNAPNSNWTSHLMHGLGSCALALWASEPSLAQTWLATCTDRDTQILDLASEEGAGIEGIGYFPGCYQNILEYAFELRAVTGKTLFEHEFWTKCSQFTLYQTLPDLSGRTPVGDTHYPGLSGSILMSLVARETGDGLAQWQANRILERAKPNSISVWDFILYDPTVPETSPDALPPSRFFPSVQVATFRSGWDDDAVYMHLHGGSNTWSHCHLDLNAFTLAAYGERLAIDHGSWNYTPEYFRVVEPQISTAWHNCIVIDGADQRQGPRYRMSYDPTEGGDCYSLLQQHVSGQNIEMIRGDATTAYADTLDRCWREIIYLKPDRFIIYDNLLTNGARVQRHIEWLLHSHLPMVDQGDHVQIRGEKACLYVEPVFPKGWRYRFPDRLARAHALDDPNVREAHAMSVYPEWIHIWNESPSKPPYPQWDVRGGQRVYSPDYQFMIVLSPKPASHEKDWSLNPLRGDGIEGVEILEEDHRDIVIIKRYGGRYQVGDVASDAEKVVVRVQAGRVTSVAMVNGTYLRFEDKTLISEPSPTTRAIDW